MKNIKVLGTGCANCKTTFNLIDEAAKNAGIEVILEKIEDMAEIMGYGIMSTPGVVIDGNIVHSGGVPSLKNINEWLSSSSDNSCCNDSEVSTSGKCCN